MVISKWTQGTGSKNPFKLKIREDRNSWNLPGYYLSKTKKVELQPTWFWWHCRLLSEGWTSVWLVFTYNLPTILANQRVQALGDVKKIYKYMFYVFMQVIYSKDNQPIHTKPNNHFLLYTPHKTKRYITMTAMSVSWSTISTCDPSTAEKRSAKSSRPSSRENQAYHPVTIAGCWASGYVPKISKGNNEHALFRRENGFLNVFGSSSYGFLRIGVSIPETVWDHHLNANATQWRHF